MTASPLFWDKIADRYAKRPVANVDNYQDTLDRTRRYLGPGTEVLEMGCGTGTTALKLAPDLGQITGTDLAEGMLRIARKRQAEAGATNVSFRQAKAEEPLPQGAYDAVMAFNLLHLVEDIPTVLQRVHEALKPGGHFISKSACLGDGTWFFGPMIGVMQWLGKAPFVQKITVADLDGMITAAGFDVVETRTYAGSAPTRFVAARRV